MSDFTKKASGLFDQFAKNLNQIDLAPAAAIPAAITGCIALSAANQEAHRQAQNTQPTLPAETDMFKAIFSSLGLVATQSATLASVGPALAEAGTALSRGFQSLKSTLGPRGGMQRAVASILDVTALQPSPYSAGITEGSLHEAKEMLVAQQKTFVEPDLQKGRYSGKVLGETEHHILVSIDGRSNTATAIDKSLLNGQPFSLHKAVEIQFRDGQVMSADRQQNQAQTSVRRSLTR